MYNVHNIKFTILSIQLIVLSEFTELHNHCHNPVLEHFHRHQKRPLQLILITSPTDDFSKCLIGWLFFSVKSRELVGQ